MQMRSSPFDQFEVVLFSTDVARMPCQSKRISVIIILLYVNDIARLMEVHNVATQ
jgi:hypothetical protein